MTTKRVSKPDKTSEPRVTASISTKKRHTREYLGSSDRQDEATAKKGSTTPAIFPKDVLAYVNNAGGSSIEFKDKGTPVHEISFDERLSLIQSGFSKVLLLKLKERYAFSLQTIAKILNITDRSIQNKPKGFRFTGNIAEKIFGLSDLYSYGIDIFEDRDKFRKWLDTPSPILNNKRPIELFLTQLGMQQVRQELARIDYGIY